MNHRSLFLQQSWKCPHKSQPERERVLPWLYSACRNTLMHCHTCCYCMNHIKTTHINERWLPKPPTRSGLKMGVGSIIPFEAPRSFQEARFPRESFPALAVHMPGNQCRLKPGLFQTSERFGVEERCYPFTVRPELGPLGRFCAKAAHPKSSSECLCTELG